MHIGKTSSSDPKKYPPASFMGRLRERKIVATLAAFAGSGVVIIEVAHHILVNHYHLPHQIVDICIVTLVGALLGTLTWRWFRGAEKRPGNVKVEVLVAPLIILLTLVIDLRFIFNMTDIPINMLLIGIAALGLGVAWIIFKSLQWAATVPEVVKKDKVLRLTEKGQEEKPISFPEWKKSIVVLPFQNISPEEGQDYFCDGMTEEIITDLSQVQDLLVISRSSAMTYKETKKKIKEIGHELNVQYVLEGSVRKVGNNLKITAQLIDAINDTHLWANKYSGTLDDVFNMQEKVSRSIVDALTINLSPNEDQKLSKRPIKNMQAYECYLRARQDIYTFNKDGLDRAIRFLQDGLNIIGENAVIYAGMGYVYSQYVNIGLGHEEYVNKAEEYATKALDLEPESSEAHLVLGFLNLVFHGNAEKSIYHFKQALAIFPNDPDVLFWLIAGLGTNWGKPKEARQSYNRLIKVDPFNLWAYFGYILDVMGEGQLDFPVDYLTKWIYMDSQNPGALFFSAQFLAYCNHFKEASALVSEHAQPNMKDVFTKLSYFVKYAIEGDKKRIKELLTVDFVKTTRRDAQNSYFVTGLFALSGMKDEAFDWLENSVDRGFINFPFINEYDPFLKDIRGEPRFKKLITRIKHEWENFKA